MADELKQREADQQVINAQTVRVLSVGAWWMAGLGTLMVLGPGMEFLPQVVLPIAAAVTAVSLWPMWQLYKHAPESREAGARAVEHDEKQRLKKLKGDLAAVPTAPDDARAAASRKLLARIEELALGDLAVVRTAKAADSELVSALADVEMFSAALLADREAAPDQEPNERLVAALETREAEVADLVAAIRDLHAALSLKDDSTGPVLEGLQSLLDQADAEVEVRALGKTERARRARARVSE